MGSATGEFATPDLSSQYSSLGKRFGSVQRPIFDFNNGQQGMLTGGGGMVWGGNIPKAWQGLAKKKIQRKRQPTGPEALQAALEPEVQKEQIERDPVSGLPTSVPRYKHDLIEQIRARRGWDPRGPIF
jgi:hypothetical protein